MVYFKRITCKQIPSVVLFEIRLMLPYFCVAWLHLQTDQRAPWLLVYRGCQAEAKSSPPRFHRTLRYRMRTLLHLTHHLALITNQLYYCIFGSSFPTCFLPPLGRAQYVHQLSFLLAFCFSHIHWSERKWARVRNEGLASHFLKSELREACCSSFIPLSLPLPIIKPCFSS